MSEPTARRLHRPRTRHTDQTSATSYSTFTFTGFNDLTSLSFAPLDSTLGNPLQFDNVVLNAVPAPEASSTVSLGLILALGLAQSGPSSQERRRAVNCPASINFLSTYHLWGGQRINSDRETGVIAYVGIGANLGDRAANVAEALRELGAQPTVKVVCVSSLYETAPVGRTDQPDFLNAVATVRTTLTPDDLLLALMETEDKMGRVRNLRWGPRVIDLDLLLYEDVQIETPGLTVPHPRLRERAFVLVPLAEIAAELRLPEDGQRVGDLATAIQNKFGSAGNIRRLTVV